MDSLKFLIQFYVFKYEEEILDILKLYKSIISLDDIINICLSCHKIRFIYIILENHNELNYDISKLDEKIFNEQTLLTAGIKMRDKCFVEYLLKDLHFNPNIKNKLTFYPIHVASHSGQFNIVKLLIKYNANVNVLSNNDITPLESAILRNYDDIKEYLIEHGADLSLIKKRECIICFDDLEQIDYICKVCKVCYHKKCLSKWQNDYGNKMCCQCKKYTPGIENYTPIIEN